MFTYWWNFINPIHQKGVLRNYRGNSCISLDIFFFTNRCHFSDPILQMRNYEIFSKFFQRGTSFISYSLFVVEELLLYPLLSLTLRTSSRKKRSLIIIINNYWEISTFPIILNSMSENLEKFSFRAIRASSRTIFEYVSSVGSDVLDKVKQNLQKLIINDLSIVRF